MPNQGRVLTAGVATALALVVGSSGAAAAGSAAPPGRIALVRGAGRIVIVTPAGQTLRRRVVPAAGWVGYLSWSPDSARIAFAVGGSESWHMVPPGGIWSLDVADGSFHQLARLGTEPTWAPDGNRVAFARQDGIWLMNSDGSGKRLLIRGGSCPTWSPDGKRIAFVRGADDRADIFVMNADGTNQQRLTADGVYDNDPAWSPDGKRIAYVRGSHRGDTADNQLVAMNPDGSRKRLVWGTAPQRGPDGRLGAHHPSWSPDGQRIVFHISEQDAIAVVGRTGKGLRVLGKFSVDSTWPSWSRR